jgi:CubicO group peptidase (beta-lactamase class C family)
MYDFQHLDRLLENFSEKTVAGCACCIAHKDEIVYERYCGYSDIASKSPVKADTVFRLASMTKIAIYTACMMLFERGAFLLDDPVSDFFPEYKQSTKFVRLPDGKEAVIPTESPMLIRHIMSMSCGLPYGNIVPGLQEEGLPPTHRALLNAERNCGKEAPLPCAKKSEPSRRCPSPLSPAPIGCMALAANWLQACWKC